MEVLGERMAYYEKSKSPVKCIFVQSYTVLRLSPDKDTYMRVKLYCKDVSNQPLGFQLSSLGLVTHVEPRPEGHIADHARERHDDSIQNLSWKTRAKNSMKENLHPDPK